MRMSVEPSQSVQQQRLFAAEASGGISNHLIYSRIVEIIQQYDLRGEALDYGAGVGNLTRILAGLNCFEHIAGADIMPRPEGLPLSIPWYCLDLNRADVLPASCFDTVIAVEVIEHLENPREVAREWHRMLKPGGRLVLSTPNNESIRSLVSLLVRGHYAAFGDDSYPAHITALLRKDIVRILSEAGFSDVRFEFTNYGGVPKRPALSWQQISLGALKGARFSDNVIGIATKGEASPHPPLPSGE